MTARSAGENDASRHLRTEGDFAYELPPSSPAWVEGTTNAWRFSEDGRRRVYRRPLMSQLHCILIGFVTAILTVGPTSEYFPHQPAQARVMALAITALGTAACVRAARVALILDTDRVVVRNFWLTRSATVADIVRFEAPPKYRGRGRAGLKIVRTARRRLTATAFAATPVTPAPGQAETAELNAWLVDSRTTRPPIRRLERIHQPMPHPQAWATTWLVARIIMIELWLILIVTFVVNPSLN